MRDHVPSDQVSDDGPHGVSSDTTAESSASMSINSRPSPLTSHSPSIFASAPRTATSQRVNTPPPNAPSGSAAPLAALSRPSPVNTRRTLRFDDNSTANHIASNISTAEKDADDPSTPVTSTRSQRGGDYGTLTTLSKLFASQVSPTSSRTPSYDAMAGALYSRCRYRGYDGMCRVHGSQCPAMKGENATLPDHLYTRGLLEGRHSDITVCAFGQRYPLHRIILDRAPFFSQALSGPWLESRAKEMTLHPEEVDPSITQGAFELALKQLYGLDISEEEGAESVGLFATGSWLEMQGLVDSSIDSILRQMSPECLAPLIKLVTASYYGQSGDRILSSAKSMLCRDGWEMPIKYWDGIPGDIIREIVGGDGFFILSEMDRWHLARRLLDRRLREQAIDAGLIDADQSKIKLPDSLSLMAVRFDAVYRQNAITTGRDTPDSSAPWVALYTHPDIEPLLVLLDEGIHYMHLDFEQLQYIRKARDIFGLPLLPEKVSTNALWMQMELRQKVLNADESNLELGLSKSVETQPTLRAGQQSDSEAAKGKHRSEKHVDDDADEMESGSWDANGKPRKFWIPSTDCNIVMGGNSEPVVSVTTSSNFQRHASRVSANMHPEDLQWASDFAQSPLNSAQDRGRNSTTRTPGRSSSAGGSNAGQPKPIAYTHFPPFRFAAEFPNPRLLKEKKRVYSRTVFYAGSLWNIYIQKVRSSKNAQLGVYLHRAKERDTEEVLSGTAGEIRGSVDERIGLLEREMLLRTERRERRLNRTPAASQSALLAGRDDDDSSESADLDNVLPSTAHARSEIFGSVSRPRRRHNTNPTDASGSSPEQHHGPLHGSNSRPSSPEPHSSADLDFLLHQPNPSATALPRSASSSISIIPPYVDVRATIKTYFKIYSPSKGGRLLSVYESAPDKFNFSQSWGWKSSTLMLDEGFSGGSGVGGLGNVPGAEGKGVYESGLQGVNEALVGLAGEGEDGEGMDGVKGRRKRNEGMLRFMVVIGNL